MNYLTNSPSLMPDDNNTNLHLFILDPLSVIIKLAVISNKPTGTKALVWNIAMIISIGAAFASIVYYLASLI